MNEKQNRYISLIVKREELKVDHPTSKGIGFINNECAAVKASMTGQEWMESCEHLILERGLMV